MRRTRAILGFIVVTVLLTAVAGWYGYARELVRIGESGRASLSLVSDRLQAQLQQYRELAVLMADHPHLTAALDEGADPSSILPLLQRVSAKTGSLDIHLLDRDGKILVSAIDEGEIFRSRATSPGFRRASQGALGAHHRQVDGVVDRVFIFSAPIFGEGGEVKGVVDVDVNIRAVESAWVGEPQVVFFTDEAGVIFITNRAELRFRIKPDGEVAPMLAQKHRYQTEMLRPFYNVTKFHHAGLDLWRIDGGPYIPRSALHLSEFLPLVGMTGQVLLDATPAFRAAVLQAAFAAAVAVVFGAVLMVLSERRRALGERLAAEERANATLENRVAERTRALSDANAALRHEVVERKEAEAALKRAQADLVQAGKLSALGKLSAGLSHELNQPLMALRSFAENGSLFLERGELNRTAENLDRISELGRRMGRIIKNLRAFARQEREPIVDVDLLSVVDAVLEIAAPQALRNGVSLTWDKPGSPFWVRGGEVRLQQVVLNLVTNAMDAMEGRETKVVTIAVQDEGEKVCLSVRDTGPGISEPEKIFDPFYSTKEVGQSEGMGLGLSISYGLVQSFGGAIRGHNHPQGGAVFTIELTPARRQEAA